MKVDLSDKQKYLALVTGVLEYSIFPHARRPRYDELVGIHTRTDECAGLHEQVAETFRDRSWMHVASSGDPADVFTRVSPSCVIAAFPFTPLRLWLENGLKFGA